MISKPKTKITFYNGLNTIGGTMLEVAYNKSHVLFDLGMVYRPELKLPDNKYQTLIKYNLIGDVPDFYDPKLTGKEIDHERWAHSAAYISHVHLDHSMALNFLDPEIPLYASKITAQLLPVLNESGDFLLPAADHPKNYTRPIIGVEYNKPIQVGDVTIRVLQSDHDAYGASALILETPDAKIAYTGDVRLHGYHPEAVKKFMTEAKNSDLLVIEGTGVSFPESNGQEFTGPKNEVELTGDIVKLLLANPHRQITFNTYPTNIERLLQIIDKSPRQVVLHATRAHLLKAALGIDVPYYYLPTDKKISDLNPKLELAYSDLLKDEGKYFWQVDANYDKLRADGLYIHSNAEPLGDFDPAYQPFIDALTNQNIEFVALRNSGHADKKELQEIIAGIHPTTLVPMHTLHPELEENPYGKRILPKRNETITL